MLISEVYEFGRDDAPGSTAIRSSRIARLFCASGILVVLCTILPVPAAAQMVYNVSVYSDISVSGFQVYGSSSTVDLSTGCGHGSYVTSAKIITPDGRQYSSSGYLSSTVSAPVDVRGLFTVQGTVQFYCSCFGNVGGGGPPSQVCITSNEHKHHVSSQCARRLLAQTHEVSVFLARLRPPNANQTSTVDPPTIDSRSRQKH